MSFWKWSKTAAANATADTSINWAEGQAPSSVNDSARAMMAAAAKFRDDTAGALATGGTSAAYAVASNQVFDSLANMNGAVIAFVPHVSNGGPCTLNVDGLTAKPVRAAPGVDLGPGVLVAGTPYAATYRNASGEWLLHGFYGNTGVPLGVALPYFLPVVPGSSFAFPTGQAISRTTYSALFALMGTSWGAGDGATTFNLPSLGGRLLACRESMNGGAGEGLITAGVSGISGVTLGAVGGSQVVLLDINTIPSHVHPNSLTDPAHSHANTLSDPGHTHTENTFAAAATTAAGGNPPGGGSVGTSTGSSFTGMTINNAPSTTGMTITNAAAGGGLPHNNMPPTLVCNYIMRII
jgi:microcystin-dependent protein